MVVSITALMVKYLLLIWESTTNTNTKTKQKRIQTEACAERLWLLHYMLTVSLIILVHVLHVIHAKTLIYIHSVYTHIVYTLIIHFSSSTYHIPAPGSYTATDCSLSVPPY